MMPFNPELHYMYLFMKRHIEATFPGLQCQRGDERILTTSILEKIVGYIQEADVLIADCSGRNPNVFYEMGIAHALAKPVILITSDPIEDAPTDVRAFEFIRYELDDHVGFIEKLDRALNELVMREFEELYEKVAILFEEFRTTKHLPITEATKSQFRALANEIARTSGMPSLEDPRAIARLFLPLIVDGPPDLAISLKIKGWIEEKFGS
jgi:nucleoside 2-deoxyribosyltransferase